MQISVLAGCFWLCPGCPGSVRFAHPVERQRIDAAKQNNPQPSGAFKKLNKKSASFSLEPISINSSRTLSSVPEEEDSNAQPANITTTNNDEIVVASPNSWPYLHLCTKVYKWVVLPFPVNSVTSLFERFFLSSLFENVMNLAKR